VSPTVPSHFPGLTIPREIRVVSDINTVASAKKKMAADGESARRAGRAVVPGKTLTTIPEFSSPAWSGRVVPQETLQLIGEALTPVLSSSAFDLSRQWARYRYFWAFADVENGDRRLRLSNEAYGLADHHRTLSAEQLGIGIALQLGDWLLRQRHRSQRVDVRWVDADVALDRGSLDPQGTFIVASAPGAPKRMRPDYFFTVTDRSTGQVTVYALEVKGTHTPRHWMTQMAKGARQVAAVRINNSPPTGLVFSTELSDQQVIVRALDPAGDKAWSGHAERGDGRVAHEDVELGLTIVDQPAAFRHSVLRAADASLLAFAGQHRTAAATILPPSDPRRDIPQAGDVPLERAETPVGDVLFTRMSLPLGDHELRIRTGAAADVLMAARQDDPDVRAQHGEALEARLNRARTAVNDDGLPGWIEGDADGQVVEGIRPTGTYMRAEIAERGQPDA
jgi:hypothetical protein